MGVDRQYFVRLDTPAETARATRTGPGRTRRRRVHVPFGVVVIVLVAGWLLWAQGHEGGARGQIEGVIDRTRDAVKEATADPGLKRAAAFFDAQHAREGRYRQLTEVEQRTNPDADWGVGVVVEWCNDQAIVLRSLTGSGTISRLLLRGEDLGDALGEHACPSNYARPVPWRLPERSG
jgi:hypothetical protein